MISHDTQLCLTEPEGADKMEREEGDKEGEVGGDKMDKQLFPIEVTVLYQKPHPTHRLSLSMSV